jgi:hypothetical protein
VRGRPGGGGVLGGGSNGRGGGGPLYRHGRAVKQAGDRRIEGGGRVNARGSLARIFHPEEEESIGADISGPHVSEKERGGGGTGSGFEVMGRGPVLASGRIVSPRPFLFFPFISLSFFCFSFVILQNNSNLILNNFCLLQIISSGYLNFRETFESSVNHNFGKFAHKMIKWMHMQ